MNNLPLLGRIVAPHFVAGIDVVDDHVVFSAPILRYMIGWHVDRVWNYCIIKGWDLERVA